MNTELIKLVQSELSKETGLALVIDGDAGRNTVTALLQIIQIPSHWDLNRQLVGYVQYRCNYYGINAGPVDGKWGPQTEQGYEELTAKAQGVAYVPWRDNESGGIGEAISGFVGNLFGGKSENTWPNQNQRDLEKYYGKVGTNQTKVTCPYPLRIAWDLNKTVNRFTCHELVAVSLSRVLERVQDHYGDDVSPLGLDLFGGCLNVRKMRGGTSWSTHSWGISLDWDPSRNKLRWKKDRASFASSKYDVWWKLWEEEGWVSLGRTKGYDWMHVQAANVKKR